MERDLEREKDPLSTATRQIVKGYSLSTQNYPGLPQSYRRPNLSHFKLVGRRNHHDFIEFRFFKETYCTRNTATTREDCTALQHVISLKPTRPNQPAQDLYSLRFKVSTKLSHLFWKGGSTSLYCYDFVFSKNILCQSNDQEQKEGLSLSLDLSPSHNPSSTRTHSLQPLRRYDVTTHSRMLQVRANFVSY